jgi:protein arginine N-methyltransferase 1
LYVFSHLPQTGTDHSSLVWDNVYGFDYSCIKDIALREPLVDTVELRAVATSPCLIKVRIRPIASALFPSGLSPLYPQHIDLRTAKKEDLAFSAPFRLTATRNDYIHAFLAWFDISFDCTHKKVQFSTGPHAQYTHWKCVDPIFIMTSLLSSVLNVACSGRLFSTHPPH